ncbi:MAG: hypothetical protein ACRDOF_01480 [Gaiellaceae bacterium]
MAMFLTNRDPLRFVDLYLALEPRTRALVEELLPLAQIGDVSAPVEIASSPCDPVFPVEEAPRSLRPGGTSA